MRIEFVVLMLFFTASCANAQKSFLCACTNISSKSLESCFERNVPTTRYDSMINSKILIKIKDKYSITTHKLLLCESVPTFIAYIDTRGAYILCPSKAYLDKLKNKDWEVTGAFLHAIAHLNIHLKNKQRDWELELKSRPLYAGKIEYEDWSFKHEYEADREAAEFLKLMGASFSQAIIHIDEFSSLKYYDEHAYRSNPLSERHPIPCIDKRLRIYKVVYEVDDFELSEPTRKH